MGLAAWVVTELDSADAGDVNALSSNKVAGANTPLAHRRNDFIRHFPFVFVNVVPARNTSFYLKELLHFNAFGGSFQGKRKVDRRWS
jgi:hypothetical protein